MKKQKQEPVIFNFKTDDYVHGITLELIDNNPYNKIAVDIWIDRLFVSSYNIPRIFDTNDDYLGRSTAVFKMLFRPFRASKIIKIEVKTKLLYNDQIIIKLLTSEVYSFN
jgi:hypothetical protein